MKPSTTPVFRPYRTEDDYWRMRELLRELFMLNGRLERNWHVARLDYARWHTCLNWAQVGLENVAWLWEQDGGQGGRRGAGAALCTIWFDDVTRSAYYEPVATVPAHRRMGLGRALLTEGLRRLQRLGCTRAFVGGYSPAANALYTSVMGPEHELSEPWVKEWTR